MDFYVYRFLDVENQIIYVGKTNNIKNRMRQHFGKNGHLPEECYEQVSVVECIELDSESDMSVLELYFINKWKPVYNSSKKYSSIMSIEIDESNFCWESLEQMEYDPKGEIDALKQVADKYKNQLKEKDKEIAKLNQSLVSVKSQRDSLKIDLMNLNTQRTTRKRKSKVREFSYSEIKTVLSYHSDVVFLGKAFLNDNKSPMCEIFVYKQGGKITIEDTVSKRVSWETEFGEMFKHLDLHMQAGFLQFRALSDDMIERAEAALEEDKERLRKIQEERAREMNHSKIYANNLNNCKAA
ncbi:excinuclease ABC subunit C (plasmid) [Bacillus tropicus]|uniref:nucleotide excision repair endonuclease n=1 Tax=Bacillus tropicus TaxID=2026188 RepID=UPI000A206170|nr:excinuclease ABC subunit C [Bacillus cereus]